MADDIQILDAEMQGSGNRDGLSFQQIVLEYLRKIGHLSSVELRGGYIQETATSKTYVPDSREVLSNAIRHLDNLLFAHYTKDMKKESERITTTLKEREKYYSVEVEDSEKKKVRRFSTNESRTCYHIERVELYLELFREICIFLKEANYLAVGTEEDWS